MNILAIDTSTEYLSIAVTKSGKIAGRCHKRCAMAHSRISVPTIDRVLKNAKLSIKDIDIFVISIGPGSFTGLRIGVTVVKGLAYCLDKKIVAVPTLDVIAQNAKFHKGTIVPVLDARKGKVYACIYRSDGNKIERLSKYLLVPAHDLLKKLKRYNNALFLGDAAAQVGPAKTMKSWHPRAEAAISLAMDKIRGKDFVMPEDLEPFYMYSKECDILGR